MQARDTITAANSGIEAVFVALGRHLEGAMVVLGELGTSVAALPSEIDAPAIRSAEDDLVAVAGAMGAVQRGLPGETDALASLAGSNQSVSRHVQSLVESIRTIVILARTARIQSAALSAGNAGFAAFADDIVRLAVAAQSVVGRFQSDHGKLSATISTAVTAHRQFVGGEGQRLTVLAEDLRAAAAELAARREDALHLSDSVANCSASMSSSVGSAIMSLQVGDSTRQRLEHVCEGIDRMLSANGSAHAAPDFAAALATLAEIEAAQLDRALDTMSVDAGSVRGALEDLALEAQTLVEAARSLAAGAGTSHSFMEGLADRLSKAAALTAACDAARAPVENAVRSVDDTLGRLQDQTRELQEIVAGITLVGINAAVRSARFGSDGQALAVIAQDLRLYADRIVTEAKDLMEGFDVVTREAERLGRNGAGAATTRGLDGRLGDVLDAVRAGSQSLSGRLSSIERQANTGCAALTRTAAELDGIDEVERSGRMAIGTLGDFIVELGPVAQTPASDDIVSGISGAAKHTMAAEREIAKRRRAS
jgi:hypothetical protein